MLCLFDLITKCLVYFERKNQKLDHVFTISHIFLNYQCINVVLYIRLLFLLQAFLVLKVPWPPLQVSLYKCIVDWTIVIHLEKSTILNWLQQLAKFDFSVFLSQGSFMFYFVSFHFRQIIRLTRRKATGREMQIYTAACNKLCM